MRITNAEVNANARTIARSIPRLEPGKAYYWKVVVLDGKGGKAESETRRFVVRK